MTKRAFVRESRDIAWQNFAAIIPGQETKWYPTRDDAQREVDRFNAKQEDDALAAELREQDALAAREISYDTWGIDGGE